MKLSRFFLVLAFGVLSLWSFALQQAPAQAAPTLAGPATVKVSVSSQAGTIITDEAGRTLYLLTADELNKSNCAGQCADAWPPLLTEGAPVAGPGAAAARLRTLTREDGATQVTYNGWALYYFSLDERPGDVRGQGVNAFGGSWFVVSPYGGPRQTQAIVSLTQHAALGPILTDASGRTLYLTTGDTPNKTNCFGSSADRWPSLLTIALPAAGAGIRSDLLGTIKREEGSTQVTYNGWPLYYFNRDDRPGFTAGQNITDTCGIWYVLSAAGQAILAPATPAAMPRTGAGGLLGAQDSTPYTLALALLLGVATISSLYCIARRSRP